MPHHNNNNGGEEKIQIKVRLGETIQMVSLLKSNAGNTKGSRRRWLKHLRLRIRAEFNLKMEDQFVVCYDDKMADEITLTHSHANALFPSTGVDYDKLSKIAEFKVKAPQDHSKYLREWRGRVLVMNDSLLPTPDLFSDCGSDEIVKV